MKIRSNINEESMAMHFGYFKDGTVLASILEYILKKYSQNSNTNTTSSREYRIDGVNVHENGIVAEFTLDPAYPGGALQYEDNIQCMLFIPSNEEQIYLVETNRQETKKKEELELIDEVNKKIGAKLDKEARLLSKIPIKNKRYLEVIRDTLPRVGNALNDLQMIREEADKTSRRH